MWRRTSALIAAGITGLVLVSVTACGSPGPSNGQADDDGVASLAGADSAAGTATPSPTSTMSEEDRALAFAACMRENGVPMADPEFEPGGGIKMKIQGGKGARVDPKAVETAQKKCKEFAPFGGKAPKLDPKQVEAMQKMAQCMRDHGVDVPDPGDDGLVEIHKESKDGKGTDAVGIDPEDPKVEAAMKACEKFMPKLGVGAQKGDS